MASERFAHYEIVGKIGAGGMGEVFRARDTKLGRDVALKFLPDAFAADPDRLTRFEREAKVLASLNHAHIGAIYGLEQEGDRRALALELVEGEDLAERIARGRVPVDEALAIAVQIAEALEAANELGVVHRDLKPANVKITPDGYVKVLDFGLAKALDAGASQSAELSHSPTVLGSSPTVQGVILGTAAYMSPEQARGKPVDRRADIFAFGAVLYELITGQRAFTGDTVSDTLASVLARDPDWEALPPNLHPAVDKLLRRCLDKDASRRLRDIGEARIILEDVVAGKSEATAGPRSDGGPARVNRTPVIVLAAVAAVAVVAAAWFGREYAQLSSVEPQIVRTFIPPAKDHSFSLSAIHPGFAEISPDGRRIAFAAHSEDSGVLLYVRDLDELEPRAIAGTEGAGYPFWSPDARQVGYFADGKLKRVDAEGGPSMSLCDATYGKGGSWNADGVIIAATSFNTPISRVPATGGEPVAVTELHPKEGENSHRHPFFLPDGRSFLYFARGVGSSSESGNKIMLASLDADSSRFLLYSASQAVYASGHILYVRESSLMARPFDPEKKVFTGDAFPLVEQVKYLPGAFRGMFCASQNGVLIYQTGIGRANNALVWTDRAGQEVALLAEDATFDNPKISPDEKSVAVQVLDPRPGTWDIWTYELDRGLRTRFTFDMASDASPFWSNDGSKIVWSSVRAGGTNNLYAKPFVGSGTEEVFLEHELPCFAGNWSPDGRFMTFWAVDDSTRADVWILPVGSDEAPYPFIRTPFRDAYPRFSPDGKWLAYESDESGTTEIYLTRFPEGGRKWQLSTDSGFFVHWRGDGREVFFNSANGENLSAVEIEFRDGNPVIGAQNPLFRHTAAWGWDVAADGQRFLLVRGQDEDSRTPLTVVLNWDAELKLRR